MLFLAWDERLFVAELSVPVLFDLDQDTHRVYGIKRAELLLVRPDGHVGSERGSADVCTRMWIDGCHLDPCSSSPSQKQ